MNLCFKKLAQLCEKSKFKFDVDLLKTSVRRCQIRHFPPNVENLNILYYTELMFICEVAKFEFQTWILIEVKFKSFCFVCKSKDPTQYEFQ